MHGNDTMNADTNVPSDGAKALHEAANQLAVQRRFSLIIVVAFLMTVK